MKLKHYYKLNPNTKQPIPGSNVKRKSSPGRFWREILRPCCDLPDTIPCTCGFRFFVQLDSQHKPIPGSLIKRKEYPKMSDGIVYMEINWESICCD